MKKYYLLILWFFNFSSIEVTPITLQNLCIEYFYQSLASNKISLSAFNKKVSKLPQDHKLLKKIQFKIIVPAILKKFEEKTIPFKLDETSDNWYLDMNFVFEGLVKERIKEYCYDFIFFNISKEHKWDAFFYKNFQRASLITDAWFQKSIIYYLSSNDLLESFEKKFFEYYKNTILPSRFFFKKHIINPYRIAFYGLQENREECKMMMDCLFSLGIDPRKKLYRMSSGKNLTILEIIKEELEPNDYEMKEYLATKF